MTEPKTVILRGGVPMPRIGYGTWPLTDDEARSCVRCALQTGYRMIDTASAYENERGVGDGIRESGVPRSEIFLTTKVRGRDQGYERTLRAFDRSAALLGTDYLDLYLIHWPNPSLDLYVETWRALGSLYDTGQVRAIGVSNFRPSHISRLLSETNYSPEVNQVKLCPLVAQAATRQYHASEGIVTVSWSPLGKGTDLLERPPVMAIAARHRRTSAQIILRWHIQLGLVVIPKSGTPSRIEENLNILDFELRPKEMAILNELDGGLQFEPNPDVVVQV